MGLGPAEGGELYAVVGDGLVDFAVFWGTLAVGRGKEEGSWEGKKGIVLLPSDWACLMTMISLGFAMVARPVVVVR